MPSRPTFLRDHIPGMVTLSKRYFSNLPKSCARFGSILTKFRGRMRGRLGFRSVSDMSDQQFIDNVQDESYSTGQQIQGGPDL